jgi:stage II sporulation protein D
MVVPRRSAVVRTLALGISSIVAASCTSTPAPHGSRPPARASLVAPSGEGSSAAPTADVVKVVAPRGDSFLLHARYPHVESSCKHVRQPRLEKRYPGTLSIRRSADGTLSITVSLPFERYLQGIAEMPPSWPPAALEAQAVAARSYALATTGWSGQQGATLKTPICATSSCQVYAGMPLHGVGDVRRWYRAVRSTAGQVLLFDGRPADTVYFSTSNGHTYGNEDVFGSSPLPYLRPVIERNDTASPVSRWSVSIPYTDLAAFLARAGDWDSGRPIRGVRLSGGTVLVTGGGSSASIDLGDFRDAVNGSAPCLMPGRYPPDGLPVTIPSSWLSISGGKTAVTVAGRGWGHGVGMVQWGAYGKARLGWSADQILAYYYGGLHPQGYPEPGTIHVRVASGLTSISILPSAPGATLDEQPLAPGPVLVTGGQEIRVASP